MTTKWDAISDILGGILREVVGTQVGKLIDNGFPNPLILPGTSLPGLPQGAGEAAERAEAMSTAVDAIVADLRELDQRADATTAAMDAASQAGRQQLREIEQAVRDKVAALGSRLNSWDGQKELRDFLKEKLEAAKLVLEEQYQWALNAAKEARDNADSYDDLGREDTDKPDTTDIGPADGGADQPETDAGGDPPNTPASDSPPSGGNPAPPSDPGGTAPASAATPAMAPGMTPPMGAPMGMPPMGMPSMPMPSMPSGGGMPGGGMGDPLGGLASLGGPPDAPRTEDPGAEQPGADAPKSEDQGPEDTADETGTHPAGDSPPDPPSNEVKLPDGTTSHAPDPRAATAVRAALDGATVSDAYQRAGITVPAPGTPVAAPLPANTLMAGDVGVWTDHHVMSLGNDKVLVSGQVQPQSSVDTSADFLGWLRPTADQNTPPPSAPIRPPIA